MLNNLRRRTGLRDVLVALAALALAFKLMIPPGFMPGASLAQPILICTGQGAMMIAMPGADHGDDGPTKAPHQGADHPCPFATLGAAPLAPDATAVALGRVQTDADSRALPFAAAAPGRGMAAPPPPSHAPPPVRA